MTLRLDTLIHGGQVFDGLGSPPRRLDVACCDGRVTLVPSGTAAGPADADIDATGCYVTPGFIDIHGHSDYASLLWPDAASRVAAGITTECNGNCGYGAFPLAGEVLHRRQEEYAPERLRIDWRDVGGYFETAESRGCAVHRVTLIGHGNVRAVVVGYENVRPTPAQLDRMCGIVDACMSAGCAGLSSGLAYPPGMWADVDELAALAKVVARHGGMYASHIRSEGDGLIESVQEFLEVLRRSGCRGQFSHVKTAEPQNWDKIGALRQVLLAAREEGLDFGADRYPYIASATDLGTIVLPRWARAGTNEEFLSRLADRATRERILADIRRQKGEYLPRWQENVVVTIVAEPSLRRCVGKNMRQVAEEMGLPDPLEATIKLIHDDRGLTQAVHFSMSMDNLREIYSWPFVGVGSDSSCRDYFGDGGENRPHPRAYGTPARFLDLVVRQWRLLDWPEAIRRMTSLPAQALGLRDRGVLREGSHADLAVFHPDAFADAASYENPCHAPTGVVATVVEGQVVWRQGAHTHARPGRLLRPTA